MATRARRLSTKLVILEITSHPKCFEMHDRYLFVDRHSTYYGPAGGTVAACRQYSAVTSRIWGVGSPSPGSAHVLQANRGD